jgi:hypothetical protein
LFKKKRNIALKKEVEILRRRKFLEERLLGPRQVLADKEDEQRTGVETDATSSPSGRRRAARRGWVSFAEDIEHPSVLDTSI